MCTSRIQRYGYSQDVSMQQNNQSKFNESCRFNQQGPSQDQVLKGIQNSCRKIYPHFQIRNYLRNYDAVEYRERLLSKLVRPPKHNTEILQLLNQQKNNYRTKSSEWSRPQMQTLRKLERIYKNLDPGQTENSVYAEPKTLDPSPVEKTEDRKSRWLNLQRKKKFTEDTQEKKETEKSDNMRANTELKNYMDELQLKIQSKAEVMRLKQQNSPLRHMVMKYKLLINHFYPAFNFKMKQVLDEYLKDTMIDHSNDVLKSISTCQNTYKEQFLNEKELLSKISKTTPMRISKPEDNQTSLSQVGGVKQKFVKLDIEIKQVHQVIKQNIKITNSMIEQSLFQPLEEKFRTCITNKNKYM